MLTSDFSDTIPSLPPEELQQFMVGPQMVHEVHAGDAGVLRERVAAPRELAGRNALVVFLESLLPWIQYANDGDGHPDPGFQDQNIN